MKNFKYTRDSDGFIIAVTQQELDKFNRDTAISYSKWAVFAVIAVGAIIGIVRFFS